MIQQRMKNNYDNNHQLQHKSKESFKSMRTVQMNNPNFALKSDVDSYRKWLLG